MQMQLVQKIINVFYKKLTQILKDIHSDHFFRGETDLSQSANT